MNSMLCTVLTVHLQFKKGTKIQHQKRHTTYKVNKVEIAYFCLQNEISSISFPYISVPTLLAVFF